MIQVKDSVFYINPYNSQSDKIYSQLEKKYNLIVSKNYSEAIDLFNIISFKVSVIVLYIENKNTQQINLIKQLKSINPIPEIITIIQENCLETITACFNKGTSNVLSVDKKLPIDLKVTIQNAADQLHNINKLKKTILYTFSQKFHQKNTAQFYDQKKPWTKGSFITINKILSSFPKTQTDQNFNTLKEKMVTLTNTLKNDPINILIIEDNIPFLDALTELLTPLFQIKTASQEIEIINAIKEPINYDIILLDIYLPNINGIELINTIKTNYPLSGIIVMTAYTDAPLAMNALRKGAIDFLLKPFLKEKLLSNISKSLQTMYFEDHLTLLQDTITQYLIEESHKLSLLTYYAKFKIHKNIPFYTEEIYIFFPQFRNLPINPKKIIPKQTLEDGMLLIIDQLKNQLASLKKLPSLTTTS